MTEPLNKQSVEQLTSKLAELRTLAESSQSKKEINEVRSRIAQVTRALRLQTGIGLPSGPLEQAQEVDDQFAARPHLDLLSSEISDAVRAVERGQNRQMVVSMPPRSGKTELISKFTPLWVFRRHPDWSVVLTSYDGSLTAQWAKSVRSMIEEHPELGIALASRRTVSWDLVEGGSMFSTSVRGALTGRGARIMIIDDPVKDFAEAHSLPMRNNLWDWWLSVAQTRLEPPYLVIMVGTRWHEDDMIGRVLSEEYEGDPKRWRKIALPAISEGADDALNREADEPLYSPIVQETREQAIARWEDTKVGVGMYTFAAMYQQRPAPAKGAIFDMNWWKYWTKNPDKATDDGRVVYLDPAMFDTAQWVDSWDCAFGQAGAERGGWVVGQRWMRYEANRYLIAQQRERMNFTETLEAMSRWAKKDDQANSPYGDKVHEHLVEAKANGTAIIEIMKDKISGLKPINPTVSKEARARSVTPEIESGNVYLPLPSDPENYWVQEFLSEMRNFPHDVADDQVDSLTQALSYLRFFGTGNATVPGGRSGSAPREIPRNIASAALTDTRRQRR